MTASAGLILLPVLSLLLMLRLLPKERSCWRGRLIGACVLCGVFLALSTEGLSAFGSLNPRWVAAAWAAKALALLGLLRWRASNGDRYQRSAGTSDEPLPQAFRVAIWGIGLVLALTGLVALVAPPNTWDSMSYHMARVAHWIQNGAVSHYPTHYLPQLYHPPWAEFAILHLQILSGGDRFANAIQWLSMVGSVLGVSLIAKLLVADLRTQVLASVLAATIPMGILQGSGTKNDFVAAFWLVSFMAYALRIVTSESRAVEWRQTLGAGASLGLALLTKGTAYIYAAPFVVWLTLVMLRRARWRALPAGLAMASLVLLLNGAHFSRNTQLFGSPLSNAGERWFLNEVYTPAAFASNVIRNLSLHMGTPVAAINARTEWAVRRMHHALGIAVDDPRTSSTLGEDGFGIHLLNTWEESAGNPLHAMMILAAIAVFVFRGSRAQQPAGAYLVCVSATVVLFNALLKWQPWNSRLHLPLFVLFAPFVAVVFAQWRARQVTRLIAILLVASSPWVLANRTRPLVPVFKRHPSILVESRLDQYFSAWASRPLKGPYLGAAAFVREQNLREIGLMLRDNAFEYQLWVLLKRGGADVRLEHVAVGNVSSSAVPDPTRTFTPAAIIRVRSGDEQPRAELRVAGGLFVRRWSVDPVEVHVRVPPLPQAHVSGKNGSRR